MAQMMEKAIVLALSVFFIPLFLPVAQEAIASMNASQSRSLAQHLINAIVLGVDVVFELRTDEYSTILSTSLPVRVQSNQRVLVVHVSDGTNTLSLQHELRFRILADSEISPGLYLLRIVRANDFARISLQRLS